MNRSLCLIRIAINLLVIWENISKYLTSAPSKATVGQCYEVDSWTLGVRFPPRANMFRSTQETSRGRYVPVLPNKLLNLLDIGELIENTGVDEPMDVD